MILPASLENQTHPARVIQAVFRSLRIAVVGLWFAFGVSVRAADEPSAEQVAFFESQVRPLLVQHCHECHGAKKQEAGLRLDARAGLLKGSDEGAVMVAGQPDASKLFQAVLYTGGTQMPPKGKLPAEQVDVIKKWIEQGGHWPQDATVADGAVDPKHHWAFQPIERPAVPFEPSADVAKVLSPIDALVAASLAELQLSISEPAGRSTLIRRMMIDLLGMPPTFDEVVEFDNDASPDACERLLDRLLASPHYGPRWGRHWLDIARYADSKGYVFTAESRYPYSYTYRDYVVDAFNADKPFDQFVTEQLAADALVDSQNLGSPSAAADSRLAALGFLTVGRRYLNNNQDIIDDRIDVVSRGLLGLTVGCARCHDHKFDPIPSADYYSLYGVFSSTVEPEELPIIGRPKSEEAYQTFVAELAKREAAVVAYEIESVPKLANEIREVFGDSLQQIAKQNPIWAQTPVAFLGSNEPRAPIVARWKSFLDKVQGQPASILGPWVQLAVVAKPEEFPAAVTQLIASWSRETEPVEINPLLKQAITQQPPENLIQLAQIYGWLFKDVQAQWTELRKTTPDATQLSDAASEQLRQLLHDEKSAANVTLDEAKPIFGRDIRDKITKLQKDVDNLKVMSPGTPPRAMIVRDGPIHEPVVFIRGNAGRPGKKVPRQFLEIASGAERQPFTRGSGRLELAESVVSPRNPLTSRVIVNRIWQHHFGTGIVTSASDFGTRGMAPSLPKMLDWLAAEMAGLDGQSASTVSPVRWSIKHMHRLIMSSAVYRQSSADNAEARMRDPENRLHWRMPRQRLDLESWRDSLLAVSGRLNDAQGGQPFDGIMNPATTRRSVYAFINRNDLPGIFRAFDFADTDSSAAERPQTTVPQQSLFAMNSPFIQEQARQIASGLPNIDDNSQRVNSLYQRILSRLPTDVELQRSVEYVTAAQTSDAGKLSPWDRLAQVLLMTNEFSFVD